MINYLLIELWNSLPLIIILGVMYVLSIKMLTPNPRKMNAFVGWILIETFEHVIAPILLLLSFLFMPIGMFYISLCAFVFITFGLILGKAKTKIDYIKLWILFMLISFIMIIPEITFIIDAKLGVPGIITLVMVTAIFYMVYKFKGVEIQNATC